MYIILLVVLVLIIFFFAYRYYAQQKLKMSELRNEISQDLHDEVGSTLSGIAMYSYIIKNQN
jgi:signal transduction histidine kinase